MEYAKALTYANDFYSLLLPACEALEIVGSVKRNDKPEVHDIEYLAILKNQRPVPEFGKPNQIYKTILEKILSEMEYNGLVRQAMVKRDGERLKKRAIIGTGEVNEFCFEIYIVTLGTWGIQNVIRTGPSLFSHRFVTNQRFGFWDEKTQRRYTGLLPNDLTYVKGEPNKGTYSYIKRGEERLALPTELDAIEVLGLGWIPPCDRGKVALTKFV